MHETQGAQDSTSSDERMCFIQAKLCGVREERQVWPQWPFYAQEALKEELGAGTMRTASDFLKVGIKNMFDLSAQIPEGLFPILGTLLVF